MSLPSHSPLPPLSIMADSTIKQVNPFSGTQVWTVPGRGNRPLSAPVVQAHALRAEDHISTCVFCESTPLASPPEKARMVRTDTSWDIKRGLLPGEFSENPAQFRRVPNLFEIVSYEYWVLNFGYTMDAETARRQQVYLADEAGRRHLTEIVQTWLKASGQDPERSEAELMELGNRYFGGGHDVIISRRHYTEDAKDSSQLASSGTLSTKEHRAFIAFTVDAMAELYKHNRYARYVVAFQNWLRPAGASFDHLHKQLVAIDEHGPQTEQEILRLRTNPNLYNEWGVDYANRHNLLIAANEHAICIVGIGHRYPTLEIYSRSTTCEPWLQTAAEVNGLSDLLHAAHAATGPEVPCNEEWHHRPPGLDLPMPWRINLKWRISTLAGFEGSTGIYVNTLSPANIRNRMVRAMTQLRAEEQIPADIHIGAECEIPPNSLKYHPLVW
ncbi:DUF4921 family protein [Corynebacterium sp. A21]|uniref:DUF4921 family protein n=1 Tax=Corynebacterium sp. A21 TaxID=3457318 RepID=UPI003FD68353